MYLQFKTYCKFNLWAGNIDAEYILRHTRGQVIWICISTKRLLYLKDFCVFKGKEEQIYNQSVYSRNSIKKAILDKNRFEKDLCKPEPIFPQSFSPVCQRMKMTVGTFKNEIANKNAGGTTGSAGGVRKIQDAFQVLRRISFI